MSTAIWRLLMVSTFALGAAFAEDAVSAIGFPFWTCWLNEKHR
jgi:hypothetical protein